jgi:tryptophanase
MAGLVVNAPDGTARHRSDGFYKWVCPDKLLWPQSRQTRTLLHNSTHLETGLSLRDQSNQDTYKPLDIPGSDMTRYATKMAEPMRLPSREDRETALKEAGFNVFNLNSEDVFIDLLTDSGTGTMSADQWASLMRGDEAYAGSTSFHELQAAVEETTGFEQVVPAHQGRGAENVLYGLICDEGDVILNNTHFDTTRAHISNQGADPIDCAVDAADDHDSDDPFKGNFSLEKGREIVDDVGADAIPAVIVTITNNSTAGQPVSTVNLRAVREFADEIDAHFVIDACRFAENAYFTKRREDGYEDHSVVDIAREQLGLADAIVVSGKKDGIVNIGGFVAVRDGVRAKGEDLFELAKQRAILYEGFPTYGGMAGRDLAAMATGLKEAVEEAYVADRVNQVEQLGTMLKEAGVPIYEPVGGHAVYIDAGQMLPHIPPEQFPGQSLVCELYREGGVRAVELGTLAFHDADRPEFVRLAVPRRKYHDEHLEHIVETAAAVLDRADELPGYEIVEEPVMPELRHFSAHLQPME